MWLIFIVLVVVGLAYANGANDNFKGVATLFGSGTTNYRVALTAAAVATLLGSLTATLLAGRLLSAFSGRNLVADTVVADPNFAAAVGMGAALTVLLATRCGLPISTTHSLVGGLVGAGFAAGSLVQYDQLIQGYFLPLVASPLLAILATGLCYPLLRWIRTCLRVTEETCICVGKETVEVVPTLSPAMALHRVEQLSVKTGTAVSCYNRYQGKIMGVHASPVLHGLHYLSASVVSFARGLNDTPKIAALLLVASPWDPWVGMVVVALAMGLGGILSVRRVADTMSHRITEMNHGQGFTANLLTGVIVIGASWLGRPVSTTHVSCGALFGIGAVTGHGRFQTIRTIALAWVGTLPIAALFSAVTFWLFRGLR